VVVISEINIETGVVDLVHHHGTGIFDVLGAGMAITAKTVLLIFKDVFSMLML